MQEAYLNALAARLGLSVDQLKEAQKQARIDLVNQAVAAGRITQEQANRMIQAIQSGQTPGGRAWASGVSGLGSRGRDSAASKARIRASAGRPCRGRARPSPASWA